MSLIVARVLARRGIRRWYGMATSLAGCARSLDDGSLRILDDGGFRLIQDCKSYEIDNEGYLMFDNEGFPIPVQS